MPLTKRQKRRLLEVSRMIESTDEVIKNITEITTEYISEINELMDKIHKKETKTPPPSPSSVDLSVYDENMSQDSTKTESSTNEHQSAENPEDTLPPIPDEIPQAPEWARRLWKAIAMKCHPDRLSFQDLSALDVAKRQLWFLEARKLLEAQDWPKLIHIGIQLDEWVDDLSHLDQHTKLHSMYSKNTNQITQMQGSLAWQWGNSWDNIELRVRIIMTICQAKGLTPPPRLELVQMLVNLEID